MTQVPQAPGAAHDPDAPGSDLSRRDFVALSVGGGLALATGAVEAALTVVETEVTIPDWPTATLRRQSSSIRTPPAAAAAGISNLTRCG